MTHMISDNNPNKGDRPVRRNFNKIVMTILLIAVIAIILAIVLIGTRGHKMKTLQKSQASRISLSIPA
jgi:hypothetical protein